MINIHSVNGYMTLLSWRLGNILQLATQGFCRRFVDYKVDPCGRLRDQMEMAARTVPANIAEGSSRHQTSYETEMRQRTIKKGSHQGESFWGCTNYPNCDGTRKIE